MTECGYTPKEIREMTLHDVQRLNEYREKNMPVPVLLKLIAMCLGAKFPEPMHSKEEYLTSQEFARLIAATGGKIPGM